MQNTNQEKQSYPINQDFIIGKKLEGGIKFSSVTDLNLRVISLKRLKNLFQG